MGAGLYLAWTVESEEGQKWTIQRPCDGNTWDRALVRKLGVNLTGQ